MKSTEFTYWLQGFFEIGVRNSKDVDTDHLNEEQMTCIKQHLQLVFKYDKNPSKFCHWLEGFLTRKKTLDELEIHLMCSRITEQFEHVIDPSYGNEKFQDVLDKIHPKPFGPDTKIRC